jgi:altronate dehydratase
LSAIPTAENSAIQLHPEDNIAVLRVPVSPEQSLVIGGTTVTVMDPISAGHKVAVRAIAAGEIVLRYGQVIGRAAQAIRAGEHVHLHNLAYEELDRRYEFPEQERPLPSTPADAPTFLGYLREDGRAGTRNYIAVVAASNCAAHTAEWVARNFPSDKLPAGVDGVVAFPHGEGCGHAFGPDVDQLRRTLAGVLHHPNVSSAIILGLGCEVNQIDHYLGESAVSSARLIGMTLQDTGGTRGTVEAASREVARLVERAAAEKRVEVPASKIALALQCGGSDSFSGITANPALGVCSDMLAELGGSPLLAETPEIFGAEHLLVKRARNSAVAERLLEQVRWFKEYATRLGGNFNDNPAPGNKDGGLSNILEKSLGAVAKGGTSSLTAVYEYGQRVDTPGFGFMNSPGYDPVSMTGQAAGGCNIICFTTGRGSASGFPTVPVIKIATNSTLYKRMSDDMDVNAGVIAEGEKSVQQVGKEIFDLMLRVASGEYRTCSERLGHKEFVPWRIGPVM